MKFMFIVKSARPMGHSPALMEKMDKLAKRETEAGHLLSGGQLTPISMGAQVNIADGQLRTVDGPFAETKEVIGGFAIFELASKEAAVASAVEFMQLHKDHLPDWEGTCEVRAFAPSSH
jgi:hypothetical protein